MSASKRDLLERLAGLTKEKADYAKRIEPFNTLSIKISDTITARILPSVEEFCNEQISMHHCIFSCGYYKLEGSVILSARDNFGNRVETIQIDLNEGKVLQSRGRFNKFTEYHDEIVKMVNLMFHQEMRNARSRYANRGVVKTAESEVCYE